MNVAVAPKVSNQHGFTLIELLIVLVIAVILIRLSAPGFQSVMQTSRMVSNTNLLSQSLHFGRSEALKRSHSVSICARNTDNSCKTGNDWSQGWLIYTDRRSDGDPGKLDGGDSIIRVVNLDTSNIDIAATARIGTSANVVAGNLRFSSRGFGSWNAGTFSICDSRGTDAARSIILLGTGSIRTTSASVDEPAKDANDQDISC